MAPGAAASVLTTGINAPDGIAVDGDDNLWVVANQEDEIDVINPNVVTSQGTLAKVVAKRGDFDGISKDGTVQGLLFPASPAFSPDGKFCLCVEPCFVSALCGSAGDGYRFTVDTRGQALPDRQDPRRDPSVDRSGREIAGPYTHGRTAGASIGMPRARSIR